MKNKTQTQELSLFGSDGEVLFDFKPSTPKVAPQQPPKVFHPDKKITDFGEKIGGARKDRIAEMVDYLSLPDDELTNKVLTTTKSKLFNFNLKELASRGYNNEVLTFLWSAMHVAENKPRKNYGHFLKNWLDDTTSLYKRCLKAIREPEKKSSYLYNEHFPKDRDLCYGYEPVDEVYDTYMAIGGYKSGKDIGDARLFRSYSMNGEDNFWYLKGAGKYSDFFEEFDDAVNSLLDFVNDRADRGINVNNTGKKKQRHVKLACWHSRTTDKYWIAPKDDKYIHLKEDIKSFNDGFKYIEDHQDELQALYNERKPFGIPLTVWHREENPTNFWIGPKKKALSDIRIMDGFKTCSEASDYIVAHDHELQIKYREMKNSDKAAYHDNRPRIGKDWRAGCDVGTRDYKEAFMFRSIEFGNWETQTDRQQNLNECYDALMDLADALNLPTAALSLNGKLALAFGSRGDGHANAHYEPDKNVINLTKTKGRGSLAHEWFHALDSYFYEMGDARHLHILKTYKGVVIASPHVSEQLNPQNRDDFDLREDMKDAWLEFADKISHSAYADRSREYQKNHKSTDVPDYSFRNTELGARAFSVYIEEKLKEHGIVDDYLCNNATLKESEMSDRQKESYRNPIDTDLPTLLPLFDNLFGSMKLITVNERPVLYQIGKRPASTKYSQSDNEKTTAIVAGLLSKAGVDVHIVSDEQAKKIAQEKTGTVYGWQKGNCIYLTRNGINPETPIHEYTHLWAQAMKIKNPEGWNNVKSLLKDHPVWDKVVKDENYKDIIPNDDYVASEVLARISGEENSEKLMAQSKEYLKMSGDDSSDKSVKGFLSNLEKALKEFWSWIGKELFEIKDFKNVNEVTDRVLYDLINGTDLVVKQSDNNRHFQIIGEKGAAMLDNEYHFNMIKDLHTAIQMEKEGKDKMKIWHRTGWERGIDGKWKEEIPDSSVDFAALKDGRGEYITGENIPLYNVLKGSGSRYLFSAYSAAKNLNLRIEPDFKGNEDLAYLEDGSTLVVYSSVLDRPDDFRRTILHEIQHAIQHQEGFARGGSPFLFEPVNVEDTLTVAEELDKEIGKGNEYSAQLRAAYKEAKSKGLDTIVPISDGRIYEDTEEAYYKLSGEVEARNVEHRSDEFATWRLYAPLSETEDVDPKEQIVSTGGKLAEDINFKINTHTDNEHKPYYEGNISPEENVIFVFGSNPEGRHGLGAAQIARKQFGARYGVGEGLTGNAYALPTKDLRVRENNAYRSISPEKITGSIRKLYECARQHPDKIFKIAYRNTWKRSLNGYSGYEMIDMFNNAGVVPENIQFSKEWYDTGRLKGIKKSIEAKMKLNAMPVNHPSVPMTESRWHHDGEIKAREDMIPDEPHSFLGPQGIHGQLNSIDKEENLHNRGGIKL